MSARTPSQHYDLAVIGTGGGLKVALPAAAHGLKTAIIEERPAGGTCLNRGCIPSKIIIHPGEVADLIREAAKLNIDATTTPAVAFGDVITRSRADVQALSDALDDTLRSTPHLTYLRGHAQFVDNHTLTVNGHLLSADRLVIATGAEATRPSITGLAGTPYMTYEEALTRTDLPRRLIVIGAGYIAAELGYAYRAMGAEVDFVVRSRFLRQEDDEVAARFQEVFARRHRLHEGLHPEKVRYEGGRFTLTCRAAAGAARELRGDALLVATGVTPNSRGLGLEHTGIQTDEGGYIVVDGRLRTAVDGVYALGDVVGNYLYRHTVNREGDYLAGQLLETAPAAPIDYGPVPHAVFAVPQVAAVGAREQDLQADGTPYVVGRASYSDSNQGLARQLDHGFVKLLVAPQTRRLLGAHILGEEAATLLQLLVLLMSRDGTLDELLDMIYIHPALPELIRDAARDARRQLGVN